MKILKIPKQEISQDTIDYIMKLYLYDLYLMSPKVAKCIMRRRGIKFEEVQK